MTAVHGRSKRLQPDKPADIVVFWVRRDTVCAECGTELGHGSMIRIEQERALCLTCADLEHLVYLPRGDVASPGERPGNPCA